MAVLSNKEKYAEFCEQQADIPLFLQTWWVEAASVGKHWDVFLYEENNKILASFVFHFVKKMGLKFILNPQLTQISGLWIDSQSAPTNTQKRLSFEKKVMNYFIEKLENERFAYLEQKFHFSVTNWQPFYWKGFEQTTHYTFRIEDLTDLDAVFQRFSYAKQKHINKKEPILTCDFSMSANEFYEFHNNTLTEKRQKISYSLELFTTIHTTAAEKNQGQIFAFKDTENRLHAALFVVWDKKSAYALISAIEPKYRNDGASTKMFWEAIKFVAGKTQNFDFEGSMIEGVAESFAQFGAVQVPYFQIRKCNSLLYKTFQVLKTWKV